MLDCAIVGGGPAGLAAGMYAARGGLKNVVVFEKVYPGGQIVSSSEIENYPGFNDIKSGIDFMDSWSPQAAKFGCKIKSGIGVAKASKIGDFFTLALEDGSVVSSKTVIFATGTKPKKADFIGEDEFFGKGVGVCAVCDGFFYKNKDVAVIGGGDSAVEESYFLSSFCKNVYLLHRGETPKAAPHSVKRLQDTNNVTIISNAKVLQAVGDSNGLNGLIYARDGRDIKLSISGVFVFVGRVINNDALKDDDGELICEANQDGRIKVDLNMRSSLPGLFCAGDIRSDAKSQVVCAAADGAVAAIEAISYIHAKGL